jgi:hypothetical protein
MNTPEGNLIKTVQKGFKKQRIVMQRLEDMYAVGLPDCCYHMENLPGSGFIEFKQRPEWPKRPTTPVKVTHFTPQQRGWMLFNGPFVQRVFLLLRVSTTYMLFPWTAIKTIGSLNRVDLIHLAECQGGAWGNTINYTEMREILRRNYDAQKI